MVKKKIRKFFNSVSIYERMPVIFEERKKKHFSSLWIVFCVLGVLGAAIAALFFVMKDAEQKRSC